VQPDVVGSLVDLGAFDNCSVDAVFSSHNLEHLYPHEVPIALKEFVRVLDDDGFFVVTCPDLQSVCQLISEGKLLEPAYQSPAGPISPIDILYGYRTALAKGNLYMAHRCGFTEAVLTSTLLQSGFKAVASMARPSPYFDLFAVASKTERGEAEMQAIAAAHFPNTAQS